ncbi:MAG: cyclopropane-fatty-acyl-phospholipid synthase family protein [Candidatus Acidiferrum sp.]|jgi:cyclopropane-fatty-acyl-phospholipid synthase
MKFTISKRLLLQMLNKLKEGHLEIVCPEDTYIFGLSDAELKAVLAVHNQRFFRRALFGGDVGIGESYMCGEWSTPDLVAVVRLGVRNLERLESAGRFTGFFRRSIDLISHLSHRNTQAGSKRNIAYHYDLGNDFYRLFLDPTLCYSCAYYEAPDISLENAQLAKLDRICQKLQLNRNDHVLEIGTGWGSFAAFAASNYGCRVTTTTISRQQYDYAKEFFSHNGLDGRVNLLFEDYRNLRGKFDKIVSIEMFEAVGYEHYDDYFGVCDRLLKFNGAMLLQTITIRESRFDQYRKQSDWIKKHIFPGAELASILAIISSLTRCTSLQLFDLEDIGLHYAFTLHDWRRRFLQRLDEVRRLGFDDNFIRMWDYYLAYCEAAFLERYISDVQLVLAKVTSGTHSYRPLKVDGACAANKIEPTTKTCDSNPAPGVAVSCPLGPPARETP